MDTPIGLEVKAEFLFQVFWDFIVNKQYQDEPLRSILANDTETDSIVMCWHFDMIGLYDEPDYELSINKCWEIVYPLVQEGMKNDNV